VILGTEYRFKLIFRILFLPVLKLEAQKVPKMVYLLWLYQADYRDAISIGPCVS